MLCCLIFNCLSKHALLKLLGKIYAHWWAHPTSKFFPGLNFTFCSEMVFLLSVSCSVICGNAFDLTEGFFGCMLAFCSPVLIVLRQTIVKLHAGTIETLSFTTVRTSCMVSTIHARMPSQVLASWRALQFPKSEKLFLVCPVMSIGNLWQVLRYRIAILQLTRSNFQKILVVL